MKKLPQWSLLMAGLMLCVACSSSPNYEPNPNAAEEYLESSTLHDLDSNLYREAVDPKVFGSIVKEDIDRGHAKGTFEMLEDMFGEAAIAEECTHLHMLYEQGNIGDAFQYSGAKGAQRYYPGVKRTQELLERKRKGELAAVYQHYANREMAKVEKAVVHPKGCLSPEVAKYASGLEAHSKMFAGILALEKYKASPTHTKAEGAEVKERFTDALAAFSANTQSFEVFLCKQAMAQATELYGSEEEVAEGWLATRATAHFKRAPKAVREGIEQRIKSYRDKLQNNVEAAVANAHSEELQKQARYYVARLDSSLQESVQLAEANHKLVQEVETRDRVIESLGVIDWEKSLALRDDLSKGLAPVAMK